MPLTSVSQCDGQRLMRSLSILDMLHLSGEFVFGMISSRYLFFRSAFTGGLLLFGEPQWWGHVPPTVNLRQTYYRNSQKYIHSNWLSTSRDIAHQWLITAGKRDQNILSSVLMTAGCRHASVLRSANDPIYGNMKKSNICIDWGGWLCCYFLLKNANFVVALNFGVLRFCVRWNE